MFTLYLPLQVPSSVEEEKGDRGGEKRKEGGKASSTAWPPVKGSPPHGKMVVAPVRLLHSGECEVAVQVSLIYLGVAGVLLGVGGWVLVWV